LLKFEHDRADFANRVVRACFLIHAWRRPEWLPLDYESTAKDLLQVVKTKKTELLFLALFLRILKPGGRAAVIVPDGVLFGSSKAHKELRRILIEDQQLQGIVSLPSGVFRPYAGVSTAILLFTKPGSTDE
jgi:type I restriction enzyme M protein